MQEHNPIIKAIAKMELNYSRGRGLHLSSLEFFVDMVIAIIAIIAFIIFFQASIIYLLGWSILAFIICFAIVLVSQSLIGTSHGIRRLNNHHRYNKSQQVRRVIDNDSSINNSGYYSNSYYNNQMYH